ncbi:AAA family ATPase [Rhodocyclus purpureus]|uniref:AAA family ATPase n=1 Tax=Rhodocyclus purpureus TaxID=1067 RepID=UPI00191303E4|nr:ATP-binding protein [Rhodocyclus purpureus]MBK5915545.1 ATPase [Rhodocyclus purpureus]
MIKSFKFENFGPLTDVGGHNLGPINVFIGPNSSGKTFLLKALYAMIRAQEETGRGDDPRDFGQVLSDKLYWTFQTDKLGDLVQKGGGKRLKATLTQDDNSSLVLEFGPDTQRKVIPIHNNLPERQANSIFLPPKEVLSLAKVIIKSGLQDKVFGFDATYVDLVLALQNPTQRGRNYDAFSRSRQKLESMFQGWIEYQSEGDKWVYRQGNSRFSINVTAEGIKKIAILDTLLGNRYLSPASMVFIDEPESALHPTAISQLLEIIEQLASVGIQFFIATHSYFVVKKLHLLAQREKISIPTLVADPKNNWKQFDLCQGIPDNEIINESIRIFDAELELIGS